MYFTFRIPVDMEFSSIFLFIITFASILILPGPNSAFAVGQSLKFGLVGSLAVPLGFMTATGLHAALVFSGVGLVIKEYALILTLLKWLGVLYLAYLGYKSFISKPSKIEVCPQEIPKLKMYFSALLVSLTNPKALLASLMVYPLFINSDSSYSIQAIVLTLSAMLVSFLVYSTYSLAAAKLKDRLNSSSFSNKCVGSLYLAAASVLATK